MSRAAERQYVQDELIFNVTEDILIAMEDAGISKAELARRLNKSKSRVSSMLSGDANMTLRTMASICFEIGVGVDVRVGNEFSVRDPRSKPDYSAEDEGTIHIEEDCYPVHSFVGKRGVLRMFQLETRTSEVSPYERDSYMDVA